MKTIHRLLEPGRRDVALWTMVATAAVCVGHPSVAEAQDPPPPAPTATTTATAVAPKPTPQARPTAIVSLKKQKLEAERQAQADFNARVDQANVCESAEMKAYKTADVPKLDTDPKKRRAQILELAKNAGVTADVHVPPEPNLTRTENLEKLDTAEKELRAAIGKKRTAAKAALLTATKAALTKGNATCDDACAAKALAVCSRDAERMVESLPSPITAAAAGLSSFQTSLVTGLAKFLQTRAEAELTTWLVTQVQRDLCSSEGKTWFPETCALVDENSGYSVVSATSLLAAAVRKDLERLPAQALAHATGLDMQLIQLVLDTFSKIHDGQKPLEILAGLHDAKVLVDLCATGSEPSKSTACVLMVVGEATRLSGDAMTAEDIESAMNDLAKDFMAAMKDKLPNSGAGSGLNEEAVKDFLRAVRALHAQLSAWGGSPPDASTALQRGGIGLRLTLSVMTAAVAMVGDAKATETWGLIAHGLSGASEILQGHPAEAVHELIALLREAAKKLPDGVARHIALVADLAAAKDASEVQAALEAAAAPVGSYLEKRRGPMLSATGLVGFSLGGELPCDGGGGLREPTAAFSPMAAVGLDFSFPVGTSTIGPFVSLIDVGQLLALPFGNPAGKSDNGTEQSAAINNEVQIAQVLSPGLFFRVGIGKSPLTWGIGASYAPQLRSYVQRDLTTKTEIDRSLFDVVRFQTFLAVDVTLMPLKRF